MHRLSETLYEAASALWQGARDHQEDAVVADFPLGADTGLVVLSDGMGGHAAGDVASKIVMTEVFAELRFQVADAGDPARDPCAILTDAAQGANACIRAHIEGHPEATGMGATLIAALVAGDRLHWISVGDSPLYLFRDGALRQLNEDHSMAPHIDFMAASGMMDPDVARDHPDRNALTSVLAGDQIQRIDCPAEGFELADGDILIAASDGLQFLENREIERILADNRTQHSSAIARFLLREIVERDDPDQDNTSLVVVKIQLAPRGAASATPARPAANVAEAPGPVRPRRVRSAVPEDTRLAEAGG